MNYLEAQQNHGNRSFFLTHTLLFWPVLNWLSLIKLFSAIKYLAVCLMKAKKFVLILLQNRPP